MIHSGAGGIGQSAINICKHYECDIYVTVGNDQKKRFIAEEYGIPENHIFSSRDIQFKYKILEVTKGSGVDIVNTLTGEKWEHGLQVLAEGGRFVEIGRYDMVENKQITMQQFSKDTSFIGVDVIGLMKKPHFVCQFFDWMHQNCSNGCVQPLNKTVFNASEAGQSVQIYDDWKTYRKNSHQNQR